MDKNSNKNVLIEGGNTELNNSKAILEKILADYKIMAAQKTVFFQAQPLLQKIEELHNAQKQTELQQCIGRWQNLVKKYTFLDTMISDKLKQILLGTFANSKTIAAKTAAPPLTVDPVKVAAATILINNILQDPKRVGVFDKISKQDLLDDLFNKIHNPVLIDQGSSNLCGPNAFVSALALRDPEAYVLAVIDLYTEGKAHVGGMWISPHPESYKQEITEGLSPADYILLSAIRKSNNTILSLWYNPHTDYGYQAFTTPAELKMWLESIDNDTVKRYESKNITFDELTRRYNNGATIIFLIHKERFMDNESSLLDSPVGNHYVTLASAVHQSGESNNYFLQIWSWGTTYPINTNKDHFQASVHEIFILDNE